MFDTDIKDMCVVGSCHYIENIKAFKHLAGTRG